DGGCSQDRAAAGPEVGTDFYDADLGDLGHPTDRTGTAGAAPGTAAEARATHRNAAWCRRRRAVGRRGRRRGRHRNVVFIFCIGCGSRKDGTWSLRLLTRRLLFVLWSRLLLHADSADGLLDQSERVPERDPGLRRRRRRRRRLLSRGGLSGRRWLFFTVAPAASSSPSPPAAASSPPPAAAGFLAGFAHRRKCGLRCRALDLRAERDLVLAIVQARQGNQPAPGGFDHELAEA